MSNFINSFLTFYGVLLNFYLFILFMAMLSFHRCSGFSPIAANGGYSRVVMRGLLIAVVSLVVEHRL